MLNLQTLQSCCYIQSEAIRMLIGLLHSDISSPGWSTKGFRDLDFCFYLGDLTSYGGVL
jgi:hypothetical protein